MKNGAIAFLQAVVVITGIAALLILLRFPLTEGRAQGLDLFRIYADPFIIYGYASSVTFFTALYQAFRILGNIRKNNLFSQESVNALRTIKYCAIVLVALIVLAGLYIKLFHSKEDDPAGFLALCILTAFMSVTVAVAMAVLGKILKKAMDIKSENDLTI